MMLGLYRRCFLLGSIESFSFFPSIYQAIDHRTPASHREIMMTKIDVVMILPWAAANPRRSMRESPGKIDIKGKKFSAKQTARTHHNPMVLMIYKGLK